MAILTSPSQEHYPLAPGCSSGRASSFHWVWIGSWNLDELNRNTDREFTQDCTGGSHS